MKLFPTKFSIVCSLIWSVGISAFWMVCLLKICDAQEWKLGTNQPKLIKSVALKEKLLNPKQKGLQTVFKNEKKNELHQSIKAPVFKKKPAMLSKRVPRSMPHAEAVYVQELNPDVYGILDQETKNLVAQKRIMLKNAKRSPPLNRNSYGDLEYVNNRIFNRNLKRNFKNAHNYQNDYYFAPQAHNRNNFNDNDEDQNPNDDLTQDRNSELGHGNKILNRNNDYNVYDYLGPQQIVNRNAAQFYRNRIYNRNNDDNDDHEENYDNLESSHHNEDVTQNRNAAIGYENKIMNRKNDEDDDNDEDTDKVDYDDYDKIKDRHLSFGYENKILNRDNDDNDYDKEDNDKEDHDDDQTNDRNMGLAYDSKILNRHNDDKDGDNDEDYNYEQTLNRNAGLGYQKQILNRNHYDNGKNDDENGEVNDNQIGEDNMNDIPKSHNRDAHDNFEVNYEPPNQENSKDSSVEPDNDRYSNRNINEKENEDNNDYVNENIEENTEDHSLNKEQNANEHIGSVSGRNLASENKLPIMYEEGLGNKGAPMKKVHSRNMAAEESKGFSSFWKYVTITVGAILAISIVGFISLIIMEVMSDDIGKLDGEDHSDGGSQNRKSKSRSLRSHKSCSKSLRREKNSANLSESSGAVVRSGLVQVVNA